MKRRTFLAAAPAAAAASLAAPAIAQGKRELKMALAWPLNFPGFGTSAQTLAKTITAASDGALSVKVHGAGELVPVNQMFDAVSNGSVDMYHAIEYYWESKSKAYNFFASIPFGMTAIEVDTWLTKYGGQELWDELSARYNIKPFAAGSTGMQMGGWYNKEINELSDFEGLKIRITGLAAELLSKFGAKPVTIPGGKVVGALKSGEIHAAEWVGPWNDMMLGLHKAAKYYYHPGFHEPGTQISVGMNLDLWISLTEKQKEIVRMACRSEAMRMLAEFNSRNAVAISELAKAGTAQIREFPESALNTLGEAAGQVVAGSIKGDPLGERILASYLSARYQLLRWTKVAEEAFLVARRLPFTYNKSDTFGQQAPATVEPPASKDQPGAQPWTRPEQQLLRQRGETAMPVREAAQGSEIMGGSVGHGTDRSFARFSSD